jgi:MFS family permease
MTYGSATGLLGSFMDIGHITGPLVSGIIATYFGLSLSFVTASWVLIGIAIVFRVLLTLEEIKKNKNPFSPETRGKEDFEMA